VNDLFSLILLDWKQLLLTSFPQQSGPGTSAVYYPIKSGQARAAIEYYLKVPDGPTGASFVCQNQGLQ